VGDPEFRGLGTQEDPRDVARRDPGGPRQAHQQPRGVRALHDARGQGLVIVLGRSGQLVVQASDEVIQAHQAIIGVVLIAHHGCGRLEDDRGVGQDPGLGDQ